jgi:hypothetical protein
MTIAFALVAVALFLVLVLAPFGVREILLFSPTFFCPTNRSNGFSKAARKGRLFC